MFKTTYSGIHYMISRRKTDVILYTITMGLCFFTLMSLPFEQRFALKVLRIAGEVALLAIIISPKKYLNTNVNYIAISLLLLSLVSLIWFRIYKTSDSEYVGAYMNYRDWSMVGIYSALVLPVVASIRESSRKIINNIHLSIALVVNLICIVYACYQFFILNESRAVLSLGYGPKATGAAYVITFVSLYTLIAISIVAQKYRFTLLTSVSFANFIAISATGTRAGMLIYPAIIIFIIWDEIKSYDKATKKKAIYSFIILGILSTSLLIKPIIKRANDLKHDIIQYNSENSDTSVGARFAMYNTGIRSSYNNYIGQSLEIRNSKIEEIVVKHEELAGAIKHLKIHLHNQLIDTLSTTGWLGVLLNILFLAAVTSFVHIKRYPMMYTYVLALIFYSLSDTIAYAIPVPLAWLLSLLLICSLINNREKN